ncbi:hypothetical protein AAHC03_012949 [Spirometra sp. Aus1]
MDFPLWSHPLFVLGFFFSCVAALVLQFLAFECTRLTSALTTSVIGVIKNIVVTYGGMFVGGDYFFTLTNFTGVTVRQVFIFSHRQSSSFRPPRPHHHLFQAPSYPNLAVNCTVRLS